LTQLLNVLPEISPQSTLALSDDRNVIILFSISVGLSLAYSTKASGDAASVRFKKDIEV